MVINDYYEEGKMGPCWMSGSEDRTVRLWSGDGVPLSVIKCEGVITSLCVDKVLLFSSLLLFFLIFLFSIFSTSFLIFSIFLFFYLLSFILFRFFFVFIN